MQEVEHGVPSTQVTLTMTRIWFYHQSLISMLRNFGPFFFIGLHQFTEVCRHSFKLLHGWLNDSMVHKSWGCKTSQNHHHSKTVLGNAVKKVFAPSWLFSFYIYYMYNLMFEIIKQILMIDKILCWHAVIGFPLHYDETSLLWSRLSKELCSRSLYKPKLHCHVCF